MTPARLQRALETMPSRAAQTLIFHCVEGRSAPECAALYGIGLAQWEILFLEAARALAGDTAPLEDGARRSLAGQLQRAGETEPPADSKLVPLLALLRSLTEQRDEVQRLLLEAERAAAASPARAREAWLRRLAVAAIIAVSLFVWLREREQPPTPPPRHFPLPPPGVR